MFNIRLLCSTVFPEPLGAKSIMRNGTFGTCECTDCLHEYSFKSMGAIYSLLCFNAGIEYLNQIQLLFEDLESLIFKCLAVFAMGSCEMVLITFVVVATEKLTSNYQ